MLVALLLLLACFSTSFADTDQCNATGLCIGDLRIAAAAAQAAYEPFAVTARERLMAAGLELQLFEPAVGNNRHQFLVARRGDLLVVACRGSNISADWWGANFRSATVEAFNGRVHEGFWRRALSVELPASLLPLGASVLVTGHSLGGAVATLVAARLLADGRPDVRCVTFGAPLVGDEAWRQRVARDWPGRFTNFIHLRDPVPAVFAWRVARGFGGSMLRGLAATFTGGSVATFEDLVPHGVNFLLVPSRDVFDPLQLDPQQIDRFFRLMRFNSEQHSVALYTESVGAELHTPSSHKELVMRLEQLLDSTQDRLASSIATELELEQLADACGVLRRDLDSRPPSKRIERVQHALAAVEAELRNLHGQSSVDPGLLIRLLGQLERARAYLEGRPPVREFFLQPFALLPSLESTNDLSAATASSEVRQRLQSLPPLHDSLLREIGGSSSVQTGDQTATIQECEYEGQEAERLVIRFDGRATIETQRRRLVREASFRWALRGFPGVQQLLAVQDSEVSFTLVQERSRSIEVVLDWPAGRMLPLFAPLAQALRFMSQQGIQHGRIDREHLVVVGSVGSERLCVTDFRSARNTGSLFTITAATPHGVALGAAPDPSPLSDEEQLHALVRDLCPSAELVLLDYASDFDNLVELLENAGGAIDFAQEATRLGISRGVIAEWLQDPKELDDELWQVDAQLAAFRELPEARIPELRRALARLPRATEAEQE